MDFDDCAGLVGGEAEARQRLVHAHQDVLGGRYAVALAELGDMGVTLEQYSLHALQAACARVIKGHAAGGGPALADALARLHSTDLYLACAMGAGDEKAWNLFAARFRKFLLSAAASFTRERAYAEQVTGDILADLFFTDRAAGRSRILSYNGSSTLDRWLWLVLQHRIVDTVRSRRNEVSLDDIPGLDGSEELTTAPAAGVTASAEDEVVARQRRQLLTQVIPLAFADLEPQDRMLLKLHFVDGAKQRHIAVLHGVHESRVSRWIDRACRQVFKFATQRLTQDHGLEFKEATELVREATDMDLGGEAVRALNGKAQSGDEIPVAGGARGPSQE